jgi:hypothetical protein
MLRASFGQTGGCLRDSRANQVIGVAGYGDCRENADDDHDDHDLDQGEAGLSVHSVDLPREQLGGGRA